MDNTKLTELEIPETRITTVRKLNLTELNYAVVDCDDIVFGMFMFLDRARNYRNEAAASYSIVDIRTGKVLD